MTAFLWRHRKAGLTLTLIFCLLGGYFAGHLPVAIFPQLTVPRIVLSTDAGDIPIQTTLAQVTRPLEAAVITVPGVTKVASTTARGSDEIEVTFAWGTDMPLAQQRMQSKIAEVRPSLPADANVTSALINPSIFPIMGYALTSDKENLTDLRRLALYTLRSRLARLPGVAQIRVTGGDVPEYLVSVRPERLAARGLTLQDVQDALAKANGVSSVGHFDRSYQRYEVLVTGVLRDPADIAAVTVATKNQVPVFVSDLATVTRSTRQPTLLATGNGKPAVVLNVIKQPDANTIQVADDVHQTLAELQRMLPPDVKTSLFYDQSVIVRLSESSVVEAIVIGGILALVVLMLFLANLRAASIVLILLPLTLLITFSLMKLLGQTLNIMTLGALAIALGLVIDDGIVVVENIFHEWEQGLGRTEAIAAGLKAITPAMVGSSLTTMAAFLPLTFLSGVTGQFFAPLALVMIATLFVSLVLSLLLTPLLASYLLPKNPSPIKDSGPPPKGKGLRTPSPLGRGQGVGNPGRGPSVLARLTAGYGRVLAVSLRRPVIVIVTLIPIIFAAYFLFNHLQTGFFPEFDEGAFVIDYKMPAGTSLAETDHALKQVDAALAQTPEVDSWSRLTGARSGSGLELAEANEGDILVRLKDKRSRESDDIISDLRTDLNAKQPALDLDFAQILQDGIGDIAGAAKPIEVKIYGDDTETLADLAHQAGAIVTKTPGVADEAAGVVETGPQLTVRVDSRRASRYGLTDAAVTSAATAALNGAVATTVQQGEEGIDVRVQATRPKTGVDPQTLPTLPIATVGTGGVVPLSSVASLKVEPGSPQITRENQQQMAAVTARLDGRDLGSGVKDVQARLAKGLKLPNGYRIEYGGLYASQQESFGQLATVLGLAVLFVSTLLVIQFRSFRQTFALLAAAILSLFGVFLGLYITKTPLNISSYTGAIMIVGIVTENGIVLFDFFNHLQNEHPDRPLIDIMVDAGRMRLRPILMTTLGAILALFPLALGLGAGAAMQKPLAVAVIGGLTVSAFFTLIVAPTLFLAMAGKGKTANKD